MQKGLMMNVSVQKYLAICIASILSVSCASNKTLVVESQNDAQEEKPVAIDSCEKIVRNLSLPWALSHAGCTEDRKANATTTSNDQTSNEVAIDAQNERNAYLLAKRKEREKAAVMYKAEMLVNQIDKAAVAAINEARHAVSDTSPIVSVHSQDALKETKLIWFAKHLRVLGPQGHESMASLVPEIRSTQHNITLRGYFMADEVNGYDPEVYSVARALAVKKKLVQYGNISPDRITILHHLSEVNGRYVEVSVNG